MPEFERHLVRWNPVFNIGCAAIQDRQEGASRIGSHPAKRWKLSPVDIQARDRYEHPTLARKCLPRDHTICAGLLVFRSGAWPVTLCAICSTGPETEVADEEISWPPPRAAGKERSESPDDR